MSFTKANRVLNKFYNNPYIASTLLVFFVVYASMIAPDLPPFIAQLFGNPFFKVFIMMMILVVKQFDPVLALLVSIGFTLSMQTFRRYESRMALEDIVKSKSEQSADSYYPESVEETGQPMPPTALPPTEETTVSGVNGPQGLEEPTGFAGTVDGYPYSLL